MTNHYDDEQFFKAYQEMDRSKYGLESAGEWHELQKLLPDFSGKRVLDLGCGYGWHCRYAVDQGATYVLGIDLSKKMLAKAREMTDSPKIVYQEGDLQELDKLTESFDVVISSLAIHYVADFGKLVTHVNRLLVPGGQFIFSVEHPVFTAEGKQEWCYDNEGQLKHWPVDNYYIEGQRQSRFLGQEIVKYHKTLTTYLNTLLINGFQLNQIVEPQPSQELLRKNPELKEELRRPMMLLVSAEAKES
ncbi:class I SAM-dependent methyltransferase [Vagococcus sp. BWB3-3]|uniref:Class I SAM-dependent methyltransferase n=1 Tax=Vagococcus allomyrinae TaxID=2794353 RepID=A0A940SY54_9ENTE|nr:class I SAM-dependent methyltransferase [Vagococcus allomyrinae]MBP1044081.1 class I SAM-dependent methyltransferase [Vagococcus allomyrinae]